MHHIEAVVDACHTRELEVGSGSTGLGIEIAIVEGAYMLCGQDRWAGRK